MFASMKFASLLAVVAASVHAAPAPQAPSSLPSASISSVAIPSASIPSVAVPSASSVAVPSISSVAVPSISSFAVPSASSFAAPSISSFAVPSSVAVPSDSFSVVPSSVLSSFAPEPTDIPYTPGEEIAISPPVTSPGLFTVWPVGSNQTIVWDTSSIPDDYKNETGLILLGYLEDGSEHLNINHPLATQFPIGQGSVPVVVPNVTTRSDYIVVLFGDSGNASPKFTITGGQ